MGLPVVPEELAVGAYHHRGVEQTVLVSFTQPTDDVPAALCCQLAPFISGWARDRLGDGEESLTVANVTGDHHLWQDDKIRPFGEGGGDGIRGAALVSLDRVGDGNELRQADPQLPAHFRIS
jgi:hypothetical protein